MNNIVVSMTSYPARIGNVHMSLMSLLTQTIRPDVIVLWLAEDEFEGESSLPIELLALKSYGVKIRWCANLKSHKKYYYALQDYSDDIVITVDDDVYYSPRFIELLFRSYRRYPQCVSCARAHRISVKDGSIEPYETWMKNKKVYEVPMHSLMATGCGGVLYPPHLLPSYTFDLDIIQECFLYQDDIWLKTVEIMADIKVVLTGRYRDVICFNYEDSNNGLYSGINSAGANDDAIKRMISLIDKKAGVSMYLKKIEQEDEEQLKNCCEELLFDKLSMNGVVIYGAGDGGELMQEYLYRRSKGRVIPNCFVVSHSSTSKEKNGIPILSLTEYLKIKGNESIIVAMSEDKQADIKSNLAEYSISNDVFYIEDRFFDKSRTINNLLKDSTLDIFQE